MKGNVFDRGKPVRVTETHVLVANVASNSRPVGEADSFPWRIDRGVRAAAVSASGYSTRLDWFVKNFKHALACRPSSLHKLIKLVQPADWIVKKCREHKECDQIADLHCARQNGATAEPKHEYRADCLKHRHRRAVDRPDPHDDKRGMPQLIADPIKAPVFFFLADETFDLTNPGKIVVQKRIHA